MKLKQIRFISLFIAFLMAFSVLPKGCMIVSAMDQSTFNTKLTSFKNTKYPNNSTYIDNAKYGGYECFGFANEVATYIFGSFPTSSMSASSVNSGWTRTYGGNAVDNLHIGDIVRYHCHSIFITSINGNDIGYCQANIPYGTNKVTYDNHITKSNLKSLVSDKLTSEGTNKTGWVAHFNNGVNNNTAHVCSFSSTYFEAAHPHKVYQQCSCGKTQYTGATRAYQNCSTCMKLSYAYVMPVKAYTINTGKTTVYSTVNGAAKSNKIYDTDLCTISQIYDCGWCKVTFPLNSGGTETGYCKISVFMKSGGFIAYTSKQTTTYRRSDLKTTAGYAGSGDKIYILGTSGSAVQIAYPLTAGGWKVGWIPTSAIKGTLNYNANGGSGSMANTFAQYNSTFSLSANKFTKTGYSFSGWNVYRSSDKKWYVSSKGWKTSSEISSNSYTKALYKNQWSGTFDKSWINLGKTNDTFTFYAVWNPNKLTVNYNANGGTINSDTYKIKNNIVYTISNDEKVMQLWKYNQPMENGLYNASTFGLTKTGFIFKGWGTTASGGSVFNENDNELVPSSINPSIKTGSCTSTLYAIWEPITYTIKYDANGGTGAPTQQTKVHNQTLYISSTQPTKNGFEFLGWSKSKTDTTPQFLSGGSYNSNNSVTLYAVWKAIAPPVTHVHEWEKEYTVDIEPTCTESGIKSIHCKTCYETTNCIQVPPTGHHFTITDKIEPSCTQEGYIIDTCTNCNERKIVGTILPTGHITENDNAVAPTCTETGLTAGKHCSLCGLIMVKQKVVEASGHKSVTDNAIASTCDKTGLTEGSHCSVCGEILVNQKTIAKKSHTYKTTTAKATTSKNGSVVTKCTVCGAVKSKSTIYYPKTISLSATSYTYDGKVKKPSVKVVGSNGKAISSSNYTVSYASGRKNIGKYAVKITFKGNYSGTKTLYFYVKPKATSISSVSAGSKKFTVKWKKQATQTTGYQIQYSTSSKFSKAKTVTVGKNSTTSKTVSKLSGKKKYYVRVRTYKTVKINGKATKIYSSWSKAKSVTTKK